MMATLVIVNTRLYEIKSDEYYSATKLLEAVLKEVGKEMTDNDIEKIVMNYLDDSYSKSKD